MGLTVKPLKNRDPGSRHRRQSPTDTTLSSTVPDAPRTELATIQDVL